MSSAVCASSMYKIHWWLACWLIRLIRLKNEFQLSAKSSFLLMLWRWRFWQRWPCQFYCNYIANSARLYSTGSASMSQWLVLELCPAVLGLSLATKMVRFTGGFELQLKNLNLFERLVRTENKRNLKRNRRNVLIQEKKQN